MRSDSIPLFGRDQFHAVHAHNERLQQFHAYGVIGVEVLRDLSQPLPAIRRIAAGRQQYGLSDGPQLSFWRGVATLG